MRYFSTLLALIGCLFTFTPALGAPPAIPSAAIVKATAGQTIAPTAGNMWGDSLTAAGQDLTDKRSVTSVLQALSGMQWNNYGIGGQPSTPIAMRQGGVATTLTFSGNQIVNNSLNTVTAINNVALVGTSTAQSPDYRLLSTPAANTRIEVTGTVCGIHGRLYATGSGGPPSTSVSYTFASDTQTNVVTTVSCTAQSPFVVDAASFASQPCIIWLGRNNYANTAVVLSDVASAQALAGGNCLVFGVINAESASEYSGQTAYTQIVTTINGTEASTYGTRFVDVRALLIANATSDIMDQQDVANGVPPNSLRAIILNTTLNGALATTGCPTIATTAQTGTYLIDSEYILATAVSGTSVTTCTRAQGVGGVAAAHSSGASVQVRDSIHINGAAEALIANNVYANKWSLLVPTATYSNLVTTPTGIASAVTNPGAIGSVNGTTTLLSPLYLTKFPVLAYQIPFYTRDGSGNYVQVFEYSGGSLQFGGGFVSTATLCTGGSGGCSFTEANNGDIIMTKGLTLGSSTDAILSAAQIGYAKATDGGTAPGAGYCKEMWVAGTNAGTGKKIAYCGTSTTPTTIIDNVGGGF